MAREAPGAAQAPAFNTLDLRGLKCPDTTDRTVKALMELPAGEVLEVISDYYPARTTVPYHSEKRGFSIEMTEPDRQGTWRARMRKREDN